ncbi:MAG: electron transport complex subunit RsxC [Gammaproteobacteria bacterium]|nr:electron transport complex subunit RsxC [Gammaproteobacteria bacterium]MBQ0840275.1 electron transport complex subunit RsxC [Gammaproteobacteria bacterium]
MSKIWDIHGGIHPAEHKALSLGGPIRTVPLPPTLILPLSQHIGAPAYPVVGVGDKVLKGQLIAAAKGFVSAPVHAPSSGVISAIEEQTVPHVSGMKAPCIVIQTDGNDSWIEHSANPDYRQKTAAELVALIGDAGITGLGGAGFPSAVKLQPRQPINTLIINATECEPYITADDQLIRERAADILIGIDILAHILGRPERILIGIEDNKPEAQQALASALKNSGNTDNAGAIEVVEFPTKYPSGGEKQLIQILTGEELPSGKLPAELGIVCQNIGTTHAIYRAICHGEALISRLTTVTGQACGKPGNFEVLIGTPVAHLLKEAEFDAQRCPKLIMGGPMMGFALPDTSVPIIKSSNCLLATTAEESPPPPPAQACIRCGHCAEVCPASLLPQQLYWHAQSKNYERLEAHHLADCIECGACSYVCPSSIPLVQYYRAAKGEIRLIAEEKRQSDRARARFEHHQARVEQEEKDKAAKREARKLAAEAAKAKREAEAEIAAANPQAALDASPSAGANDSGELDIVQAALARVAAKKASPEDQRKRFERAIETTAARLQKAQQVLAAMASDDSAEQQIKRDQQRASVEQARLRHQEAKNKLAAIETDQAANGPGDIAAKPATTNTASADPGLDRAAAAIARAQKNAAEQASMSPQQKLQKQRDALEKRLGKAQTRLAQAESEGSEQVEAFNHAVATLSEKLKAADLELASGSQDSGPAKVQTHTTEDSN